MFLKVKQEMNQFLRIVMDYQYILLFLYFIANRANGQIDFSKSFDIVCTQKYNMTLTCTNTPDKGVDFIMRQNGTELILFQCSTPDPNKYRVEKCDSSGTVILEVISVDDNDNGNWECLVGGATASESVTNEAFPSTPTLDSGSQSLTCTSCGPHSTVLNITQGDISGLTSSRLTGNNCTIPGWSHQYVEQILTLKEERCGIAQTKYLKCEASLPTSVNCSNLPSDTDTWNLLTTQCASGLSSGAIAGIICASVVVVAGGAVLLIIFILPLFGIVLIGKKKRDSQRSSRSSSASHVTDTGPPRGNGQHPSSYHNAAYESKAARDSKTQKM